MVPWQRGIYEKLRGSCLLLSVEFSRYLALQKSKRHASEHRRCFTTRRYINPRYLYLIVVSQGAFGDAGKTRTRDKYRTVYTEKQRLELEAEYDRSTYITSQRKTSISSAVGLSERQVKIWFQNRRAKDRKQRRRRTAKLQQQQQLVESETETNSFVPTSLATTATQPDRKFIDSTLFRDPRMVSMISHPTYFSTTTR